MKKCSYCGADLPKNTYFCGRCGNVQAVIDTGAATAGSNTPLLQTWTPESGTTPATWPPSNNDPTPGNMPAWYPNAQGLGTPPPTVNENEDEHRRGVPPWAPLYGAALGGDMLLRSGQAYTPDAPFVQGTPHISSVPKVPGYPTPYTNAPASPSMPGAGNVPMHYPIQGAGNAAPASPFTQGAGNIPVSYPVQGTGNMPAGYPVQGTWDVPLSHPAHRPEPKPHPPEQPGTAKHHPAHKPHHHHSQPVKHQPDRDDLHPAKHVLRREGATKIVGGSSIKTIILVVTAVAVVAAGGVAAATHFLSHPQPSISIMSSYKVGNALAGANGTVLHISGQQFSSNSAITFLLDGHVAPGIQDTQSDSNGNFSANVIITNSWSIGPHTLSAKDASNDSPQNSVSVTIVQPGQANTPGPNGAPPDDASFRFKVTIGYQVADPFSQNPVLIITGHPDPEGGTVCSPYDSGQSFTFNETAFEGTLLIKTLTATCSGTYKAGQINYIETTTSVTQHWQGNDTCVRNNPTVDLRLTGAYVGNNTFKGMLSSPYFTYTCNRGTNTYHEAAQGVPWTGTIVNH